MNYWDFINLQTRNDLKLQLMQGKHDKQTRRIFVLALCFAASMFAVLLYLYFC